MVSANVFTMKFIVNISGLFGSLNGPRNTIVDRAFIRIMLVYSAIKNRAKGPAAYSTLNPETSSDSPSVRSKGARLVSASVEIYHIIPNGQVGMISHRASWVNISDCREKDPFISNTDRRIIAMVTSYEIVCATARRAPNIEYFEFEAHPDHRMEYTDKLDVARINRAPRFRLIRGCGIGIGIHRLKARVSESVGAIMNSDVDVANGRRGSLINSFIASANGWRTPYGPTIFGPFRSCMYPKIFRSTSVRNAMAIKIGTRRVKIFNKCTIREGI